MNESSNALSKLRKVIQSLQREEMIQIQKEHGDALSMILEIAKENGLTLEHIQFAMSTRQPKTEKAIRTERKSKRPKPNAPIDSLSANANVQ